MARETDEGSDAGREPPDAGSTGPPPPAIAASRPRDPLRFARILVPSAAVIVGLIVGVNLLPDGTALPASPGPNGSTDPNGSVTATPRLVTDPGAGYLVDAPELAQRARRAAAGEEPYASSVADLLEWAESAVDERPQPVQPLVIVGTDGPFVEDARRAYGLGLAYAITADERYATAARATIRAWMDRTISTIDTCPDSGGCHTSLIMGRVGAGFAFGADLIAGSPAWTEADRDDLRRWMREVLLPAASERPNNWGDAGTFLRVVAADYAGDRNAFDAAIEKWRDLIDLIEADGRIPEEVRRGEAGISYTQEALQYKVAVAVIAERRGIDLWSYVGERGGSLRAAIDRLAYYWTRPAEWPDHTDPRVPSTGPLWEIAYARWRDPAWIDIVADRRPYGDRGHSAILWTTLTHGIPTALAHGGTPSPNPSVPTATATPLEPIAAITGFDARIGAAVDDVTLRLRWDAPDVEGATVRLERSIDGGAWDRLDIDDGGEAAVARIRIGQVQAFRVRAELDGAVGPWATLTDVEVRRLEPTSARTELTGRWERIDFRSYSDGWARSTDVAGATMTWSLGGRGLAIIGPIGPTRGAMRIVADGQDAQVVDLGARGYVARAGLATFHWDGDETRELRIEARAVGNRRTVAIDDVVTLDFDVSPEPAP